jgi:phospholipase/carboxylesterase
MATPVIDGPRLPARSGRTRQLVVFLHGYGADGRDLIDIGRAWAEALPDAAFVSPHAHEACGMSPGGRQWFPLTFRDESERWRGAVGAAPVLEAFLDAEAARHGIGPEGIALVGFSQGAMMALHVGLRRPAPPFAILGFSGLLVTEPAGGVEALRREALAATPVLLVHGSEDQVIPAEALFASAAMLAEAGVPCEWHLSPGLPHSIDEEGIRHGGAFLAACATRLK